MRGLEIARKVQERQRLATLHHEHVIDDTVDALLRQLQVVEKELLDLLTAHDGALVADGYSLHIKTNDRRNVPRPTFVLHKNTDVPAGRRQPLAAVS